MPIRTRLLALAASTAASLLLALALVTVRAGAEPSAVPAEPQNTLTRQRDPIVVLGGSLTAFDGAPLDELFAYAYNSGAWQQIPFQFDEVEPIGNTYVVTEDGQLDTNDELAFMASNAGELAPAGTWIPNNLSTGYPRYELRVVDPLNPGEQAWVYLYRSPTLTPAFGPGYINVTTDTVTTPFFSATANFSETLGLTNLTLNGHLNDMVDRSHLSVKGRVVILPVQLCEEDIMSYITGTGTISNPIIPPQDRPVRYVTGEAGAGASDGAAVYPASLRTTGGPFDLAALAASIPIPGLTLQELRISLDLLNPTASGYAPARYFNSNTAATGVPVDGVPDTVPTALAAWSQYNGSLGSIVQLNTVQTSGTSAFTYYLDNTNATAADCHGTDGAYGESGVRIAPFSGVVTVTQQMYFAAPLSQAAGATYQAYAANPLQTTNTSQLTCFFADLQPDADHTNPALCDNDVDVVDVQRVAGCWNQAPGSPTCPATLDVDRDLDIDVGDVATVANQWGWIR
jgi:hypothetical protein